MGVVSLHPIGINRRRGRFTLENYSRSYYVFYRARTSSPLDDELVVATAAGLPSLGDPYPTDPTALLRAIEPEEQDTPQTWVLRLEYSTDAGDKTQQAQDPLQEPYTIRYGTELIERAVQADLDGVSFRNTAGDPYDPPQTITEAVDVVAITQNMGSFSRADRKQFLNHANSVPWWGEDAGRIWCSQYDSDRQFRNGVEFWPHVMSFKIHPYLRWDTLNLVSMGYRQLAGGQAKPIYSDGSPVSKPAFLAADGTALTPAQVAAGNFATQTFRIKDLADFTGMPIPSDA